MAFNDAERAENLASLKWFVEHRRPPELLRAEVDIGYSVVGRTNGYEPSEVHKSLRSALHVVDADAYGCFFG